MLRLCSVSILQFRTGSGWPKGRTKMFHEFLKHFSSFLTKMSCLTFIVSFHESCQIVRQLHDYKKDEVFDLISQYVESHGIKGLPQQPRILPSFFHRTENITILSFLSMITSRVNVEHARLILPPHLVTSLAINRSKVFIGLDTMIQSRSVLRNHLFLRIFHSAWKPPLKCDLLGKGIHVTNNGDIAANDARNFSGWAISHMGVYMIIVKYTQIFGVLWKWSYGITQAPTEISKEVEVIT